MRQLKAWEVGSGAAAILVVFELIRRRPKRPQNIPVVPGHWLLGNLPELVRAGFRHGVNELFVDLHQRFGKTFALRALPCMPWMLNTTCPKNVKHILKTNFENYPKGLDNYDKLVDLLGGGIFNADGMDWYHQRKISSHMFTATLFKEHIWVVVRRNARMLRDIFEASADKDRPVDVFNLMNRFTLDTIGEIGFGKCIGSLEDPSSPFLRSFDRAQQICFWRFLNPLWKLFRCLGVGSERETCEHFGRLDAYTKSVVRELCNALASKGSGVAWADIEARKSFLGLFLEDAQQRGETLSEGYLRDLTLNFLIAGRDTTAQALSWTLFCLSQHPDAEARARQEVIEICGIRGPAYEDMPQLCYLQAVISEALRLYPPVHVDLKRALHNDTWPDGTFVPSGTQVAYDIYSMGRESSIWGEDAKEFRPERWLEMQVGVPGNYEYVVFNAGPRECLGRRLAMIEMKTCLAMLLPQMSFHLAVPADTITTDSQLTIGMGSGLPCFVSSISTAVGKDCLNSNLSTTVQSECTTPLTEVTGAPSEPDILLLEGEPLLPEPQQGILAELTGESSPDSGTSDESCSEGGVEQVPAEHTAGGLLARGRSRRRRSKPRKSGRSRQRLQKFWERVRAPTPESWPLA